MAAVIWPGTPACAVPLAIPQPSERPQAIAAETDSFLLGLAQRDGSSDFDARLPAAADALPVLGERTQDVLAARATRDQARSRLFPGLGARFYRRAHHHP